ncbi:PepSY domain-containing protein [Amphritea balenae]|uniref:PepSY domain-containing protein n=1 Tax=Amphritea balenae TaxID=452629 RepID=A0A3P1SJN9_9GAMM|nr:hypothetical protein [Amphritea balenae]RRC97267.1 hypothetical protein EHS89_18845 [Amphritea balenae]GGK64649.1 hypothetical protein GCM10007941_13520 [Amphritea balenae]
MRLRRLAIVLLTLIFFQPLVYAHPTVFEKLDYETCRILVQQKEILSLQQLSERVVEVRLGRMIDMTLLKSKSEYIYEMEIAEANGEISFFYINARTGDLVEKLAKARQSVKDVWFWSTKPSDK